uniref:Uncharacterized protein n=1 Tax=Arundo donax TaxID=35708 RepID=A0A0A9FLD3_ARUDO
MEKPKNKIKYKGTSLSHHGVPPHCDSKIFFMSFLFRKHREEYQSN